MPKTYRNRETFEGERFDGSDKAARGIVEWLNRHSSKDRPLATFEGMLLVRRMGGSWTKVETGEWVVLGENVDVTEDRDFGLLYEEVPSGDSQAAPNHP